MLKSLIQANNCLYPFIQPILANFFSIFLLGLGDSLSLPCLSADCSSSSSSVYGGCNTVNAAYSCSSPDSIPDTPTSPSIYAGNSFTSNPLSSVNIDTAQLLSPPKSNQKQDTTTQKSNLTNQKSTSQENSSTLEYLSKQSQFGGNLNYQLGNLNLNQLDYDPFNDYMGMDKMMQVMIIIFSSFDRMASNY